MVSRATFAREYRLHRALRATAAGLIAAGLLLVGAHPLDPAPIWRALWAALVPLPLAALPLAGALAIASGWLACAAWRARPIARQADVDAEWWMALFPALGMTAGVISGAQPDACEEDSRG